MKSILLCLLFLCVSLAPLSAQTTEQPLRKNISHSSGLWLGSYTKYRLGKRLFYYGEYHYRRRDRFVRDMAQIYLRFGMTYLLSKKVEITGGVVTPLYWAPADKRGLPEIDDVVPQYRFWEQLLLVQPFERLKLYHTIRLEQRWRRDYLKDSPFELTFRFRYKLSAYYPLNKPKLVNKTLFFSGYNEIFIQAGRSILYNHFEDNRMFLGLGYILSENWQVQTGYMWTYRHAGGPYDYEFRHIPRLSVYHNLDFYRQRLNRKKQRIRALDNDF